MKREHHWEVFNRHIISKGKNKPVGKSVVALYNDKQSPVDTIGAETARLRFLEQFSEDQLATLEQL